MNDKGYMPAKIPMREFKGKNKLKSIPKGKKKESMEERTRHEQKDHIRKVYLQSQSIQTEEALNQPRQVQTNIVGTQIPVCMIKIDHQTTQHSIKQKGTPVSGGKLHLHHKQVDIKVHQKCSKLKSVLQLPQEHSQFDKKQIKMIQLPRVDFSIRKISSGNLSRKDYEKRYQTQSVEDMRTCKKNKALTISKSRNFDRKENDRYNMIPLSQFKKRNLTFKDKIKKAPLEVRCSSEARDAEQIEEYLYLNINQERLIQTIKRNLDRLEGISCENRKNRIKKK